GSMQQVPQQAISSFVFPSGIGQWAAPFELLPLPTPSGIGMSGIGMSGVGFAASLPPIRPRQFWLVADAELIVYGATEPDATVTIGGRPIKLNPDGTFRFQMSFQDGLIDYPIMAVAADGEQTRSIHMEFTRETPERNTNTKDEAIDEWP
ncbi:MAG: Rho termination protein, partial [Microcoleus sp. SIO2G3]|nr:Rho termination protein [Microcoleus sp. SIO2G3]